MADGSIIVDTHIETKEAEKDLKKIVSSMEETGKAAEDQLSKMNDYYRELEKKSADVVTSISDLHEELKEASSDFIQLSNTIKNMAPDDVSQEIFDAYQEKYQTILDLIQRIDEIYNKNISEVFAANSETLYKVIDGDVKPVIPIEFEVAEGLENILKDTQAEVYDTLKEAMKVKGEINRILEPDAFKMTDKANAEARAQIQKQSAAVNNLNAEVEKYAHLLDYLESKGKGAGDDEWDEAYIGWQNAKYGLKEYLAELNKHTLEGQDKDNAQQEKEAEKAAQIAAEEERLAEIKKNSTIADQEMVDMLEERKQLLEQISDMKAAGMDFGYEDFDKAYERIYEIDDAFKQYKKDIESSNDEFEKSTQELKEHKSILAGIASAGVNAFKKIGSYSKSIISKIGKTISNGLTGAMKKFGALATGVFSKIGKSSSKMGIGNLQASFKNVLKYAFGIRSLYVLTNKLRSALKDGFGNLANYSEPFKNSVEGMKASILTLKNALAGAFQPIVEMAIPYIQQLLTWITAATDKLAQFMAALRGQNTYTKAVKQTTKALKDQNKEQSKSLSGLDKLNNLTSNKNGEDNSAAGMFEEAPVDSKWKDFIKELKDMWEKANFTKLGKETGEALRNLLQKVPWDEIKEKSNNLGKSLATLANGFINVDGLAETIGNTLAQGINTIFEFLNGFVHNFDFKALGQFIAEGLNGLFGGIDWELIKDTFVTGAEGLADVINNFNDYFHWDLLSDAISNGINVIIDSLYAFITKTNWKSLGTNIGTTISDTVKKVNWKKAGETVGEAFKAFFGFVTSTIEAIDWQEVGQKVKEFLCGIDWAGVMESMFEMIGAALGGLAAFIWGVIKDAWAEVVQWWHDTAFEDGEFTMQGLLDGILDVLADIAMWCHDHVFEPFMNGIKKAFGIASPSKEMKTIGGYVMDGFLGGLKDKWKSIKEWIEKKAEWIKDAFNGAKEKIGNKISGVFGSITGNKTKSISVPGYATGQVIPTSMKQHLAILGDNNTETEVVSPLSTIEQAVTNAMSKAGGMGFSGTIEIPIYLNDREIGRAMQTFNNDYKKQTGRPAFA